MKKDLPLLLQSIALGALSGIHQQALASPIALATEATPEEAALRLKALKASLGKPSFILKTISGEGGAFEGNFHRSHRSHSSHRSHYSSYSGSSGSYSSGSSSSGSSSSGGSSSGTYRAPSSSYTPSSSPSSNATGTTPIQKASPLLKMTPANNRLGDRMLYLGLTGNDVISLKNLLIQKGYYVKPKGQFLSNEFDEDTRKAVKKLQQANKLPEDGMVDPVVLAYLSNGVTTAPKPSLLGNRLLQWGMSGPDVVELKTKLLQKGYLKSSDGQVTSERFDDATEQAVKAMQQANGWAVTGQVTEEVVKLLR